MLDDNYVCVIHPSLVEEESYGILLLLSLLLFTCGIFVIPWGGGGNVTRTGWGGRSPPLHQEGDGLLQGIQDVLVRVRAPEREMRDQKGRS